MASSSNAPEGAGWGAPPPPESSKPPGPGTPGAGEAEQLAQWSSKSAKAKKPKPARTGRRRRWPRIVLICVLALLVVGGVLVAFAPAIASSLAPGYIEEAAKKEIAGSVKVKEMSLSWGGPLKVGPMELYDDQGKLVGTVQATLAPGLWKIVSEQWWSKKQLDVGQIEVTGKLDVVKGNDKKTNLERATATKAPATPKPKGGPAPFDSLKGAIKLTGLDVTFTDLSDEAKGTPMAAGVGVTKFGGDVKLDYDAKGGGVTAKLDLSGGLKGAGTAQDKVVVTGDVALKQDSKGALERLDAKVDLLGAPLDLVDGLVGFGGELVKSIGSRGEVHVQANGNLDKMTATVGAVAVGANANLAIEYASGVLRTTKPGTIKLRSTDFVAGLPALREKVKSLGSSVRLDAGPSLDVTIATLSLPIPRSAIEDAIAGKTAGLKNLDLRAGAIDTSVAIGAQRGQIDLAKLSGGAPGAPPSQAGFRPFTVDPLEFKLAAPQLSGPKQVTAATKATIDGKPAGQLMVNLTATGLLDDAGHFDMSKLQKAEGEAKLAGVTTALLQPLVDAAGVKVDLAQDVGPTLDVSVKPTTTEAPGKGGTVPPTDVSLAITSANIKGGGDVRYDNGTITTKGEGIVIDMLSAGALAGRMVNQPGGTIEVGGKFPVKVTVRDLRVDTAKKPLGAGDVAARAEVRVGEGVVAVKMVKPEEGKPPPPAIAPIVVTGVTLTAALVPGQPAAVGLDAALSYWKSPFTVKGDFTAPGLGRAPAAGIDPAKQGPIDKLLALGLTGKLEAKQVPKYIAKILPAADEALNPTGTDTSAEVKRLVSNLLGPSIDVVVNVDQAEGAQRAKVDVTGAGITATTTARVTPKEATIDSLTARARLAPEQMAAVLAAATPKRAAQDGQPAPAVSPMVLGAPTTVVVTADPVHIPFKAGTSEPDFSGVGEGVVRITTDAPLLVANIPGETEAKKEAAGLGNLVATARLPLATLLGGDKKAPNVLAAKVTADVLRPQGGGGVWTGKTPEVCGKADIEAGVPMNGGGAEQSFTIKLTDVSTTALSPLMGDPLLLPGTLGDRVQVNAQVKMSGTGASDQRLSVQADIDAPRLKGASIRGSTQNEVFRLDAAKMVWTPSLAWVNSAVFAPKAGATGPSDQLAEEATFTLDVKSLAVSLGKVDEKGVKVGTPLKPGVFAADLALTSPKAVIKRADGKLVRAEEIRVALTGGQKPGSVAIDATIARVSGDDAGTAAKTSLIKGTVDRLADERGVLTMDRKVVNLTGDLDTFPTPLIDSLAGMHGKVVDLLGNTLNLKLTTRDLSKTGGSVQATAGSPRATAEINGVVQDNTFVQQGKFEIGVMEIIRYEVAKKLPGGMPLVGVIEKKKGVDEPGSIKAEGLRVPTDGDMRKLNGVVTVDPGTATFEFNDAFSKILKQLSQKDRGQLGRRLDPFVVNLTNGVAHYDKYKLKFGEFTLETAGTADLVQNKMDVVTYVPAGAVTEEVVNLFKGSMGGKATGFGADIKFPFTTKGPLENPKTEPDFGLFIKENAGNLLKGQGEKAIEDLLNKFKPKK